MNRSPPLLQVGLPGSATSLHPHVTQQLAGPHDFGCNAHWQVGGQGCRVGGCGWNLMCRVLHRPLPQLQAYRQLGVSPNVGLTTLPDSLQSAPLALPSVCTRFCCVSRRVCSDSADGLTPHTHCVFTMCCGCVHRRTCSPQAHFPRLATAEFSRDRKMMSVLVRGEGRTSLWCKVRGRHWDRAGAQDAQMMHDHSHGLARRA